jgi:hypothetical protein
LSKNTLKNRFSGLSISASHATATIRIVHNKYSNIRNIFPFRPCPVAPNRLNGLSCRFEVGLTATIPQTWAVFLGDFMFRFTAEETQSLRFRFGSIKRGQHYKYLPHAFTAQGVAMLSGILRSHRAVQVNVAIMRAFVRLREALSLHKELAHKLSELERKIEGHDTAIHSLFEAIRQLMAPPTPWVQKEIGFHIKEDAVPYRTRRKPAS